MSHERLIFFKVFLFSFANFGKLTIQLTNGNIIFHTLLKKLAAVKIDPSFVTHSQFLGDEQIKQVFIK